MINSIEYPNAIMGWRDLISIVEEEDRFDDDLFIKAYAETFELVKPYFSGDTVPKDIACLLCDAEVFARYDIAPNEGFESFGKAQLLARNLFIRVLAVFDYRMDLRIKYGINSDEVTDDKLVWINDEDRSEIIDISDFERHFKEG